MKLIFFNRFFYPDNSATSQILSDLAFHLASRGIDVHVVTSRITHDASRLDRINGVTVHRVSVASSVPQSIVQKAFAYLAFYVGARRLAGELVSPGDVAVLKTDPPLLGVAVGPVILKKGAKVVHWLQDVFPEVAERYGLPGFGRIGGAWLRGARDRSLRIATVTVAIGDRMADRLTAMRSVMPERIAVVHNWANGALIQPIAMKENPLRAQWALDDRFVVGYSGNLGRVHEFETLLGAARMLRDNPTITFVIVGRGPRLQEVVGEVRSQDLKNVLFKPHQDASMLSQSLGIANVHISVLRPEFEGLVHPSKLYGVMAAGRPTVFIGDEQGETAKILRETGAGITVRTGDAVHLASVIVALRDDPARCNDLGESARRAFQSKYDMPIALAKWHALLAEVGVVSASSRALADASLGDGTMHSPSLSPSDL